MYRRCLVLLSCCLLSFELVTCFEDYGVYCGLGHTSVMGNKPVDSLDRCCQIHDICVTARSMTDAFCSEQLYECASVVNVQDGSEEADEKDVILEYIYAALFGQKNMNYLREEINLASDPGYEYIPFYRREEFDSSRQHWIEIEALTGYNISVFSFESDDEFYKFRMDAFYTPQRLESYHPKFCSYALAQKQWFNWGNNSNVVVLNPDRLESVAFRHKIVEVWNGTMFWRNGTIIHTRTHTITNVESEECQGNIFEVITIILAVLCVFLSVVLFFVVRVYRRKMMITTGHRVMMDLESSDADEYTP